jgi:hypothetical protein
MRSFAGIPTRNYPGTFQPFPMKLCAPVPLREPAVIRLDFNWTALGASTAVSQLGCSIAMPQSESDRLGTIQSVYIDNTDSIVPMYMIFNDTGFTVTAPPNTAVWYPVITNGFEFRVYGDGFLNGSIPNTRIFLANRKMEPSLDPEVNEAISLWKGSPVIQRTNSLLPGYAPPALGDQFLSDSLFANHVGVPAQSIWWPVGQTGWLYVTSLFLYCSLNYWDFAAANQFGFLTGRLADGTTGATLFDFRLYGAPEGTATEKFTQNFVVVELHNMNIRLDASHPYVIRYETVNVAGVLTLGQWDVTLTIAYTLNPE